MSWCDKALEKLERERSTAAYDKYAQVMKDRVCEALTDFCRQDMEFSQAVVQGGTFEDCMKAVAKHCGNGISDLEAFRRAVQFYFPGAEIRFQMSIDLCGAVQASEEPVVLNLADFW